MTPLQALRNLVQQLEISDYVDSKGHKIEYLQALHDARDVIARASHPPCDDPFCSICHIHVGTVVN